MSEGRGLRLAEQCRVVVDNDWAGDPDGLVALAHHLLSPTNRVVAVTSSFLNPVFGETAGTAQRSATLAQELVDLIGGPAAPPVHAARARHRRPARSSRRPGGTTTCRCSWSARVL